MNERIRELAEQAGFFPELNYEHTGWHAAGHNDLFEKFAELIVKECIAKYNEYGIYSSDYRSFIIAGHNLKKHFEVEE